VHLIATLKHVHYTELPITVVFAGEDDLTEQRRGALRSISPDIDTVNILDFFDEDHAGLDGGGWAIKGQSRICSSTVAQPQSIRY